MLRILTKFHIKQKTTLKFKVPLLHCVLLLLVLFFDLVRGGRSSTPPWMQVHRRVHQKVAQKVRLLLGALRFSKYSESLYAFEAGD